MEIDRRDVKVWDLPLRLFHWTLVVSVAVALLSAEEGSPLNSWHVMSGWIVAILIAFRLVWGFIGGEHSRFSDFIRPSRVAEHVAGLVRGRSKPSLGHNPVGAIAVVILLVLAALTVWSGAFGGEAAEDLHEVAGWSLLALVAVHVLAVVIMSLLERENLVLAMITGKKPAGRHPGVADARRPGLLAVLVAIIVVAGTTYWIVQYDPGAFTPRSSESYEQRATSAAHGSAAGESDEEHERD